MFHVKHFGNKKNTPAGVPDPVGISFTYIFERKGLNETRKKLFYNIIVPHLISYVKPFPA